MEVMANHSKADLNSLLTLCPSDDCRLLVLEARSQKDVLDQLALCPKAGKFDRDCEGHALQRWALNKPSETDILRIKTSELGDPQLKSAWVGAALGCGGTGSCEGLAQVDACVRSQARFKATPTECTIRPKIAP
jgi:hypothetical protein